jgi:c-di-GMP-binding flagellar brake protein YcgR
MPIDNPDGLLVSKEPFGVSKYSEQFLKNNPLAVLGVIRDLQKNQVPVRITWASGQFISKILEVTPEALVMDFGSQEFENTAVQRAAKVTISAETQGAKVEFTLPGLESGIWQSLPAFITPLPETLFFIQRREYFRINAPLHPAYFCKALMPNKSELRFRLFDLSLGGMGALLDGALPEGLQAGMRFSQIELDMASWGQFYFDAQLIAIGERKVVDGKNETITTPRLSFRFLNVSPGVERELQRIIFSLEREARERANRVR